MLAIGLALLVLTLAASALVVTAALHLQGTRVPLRLWGLHWDVEPWWLFAMGAAAVLLLLCSLPLIRMGARRRRRRAAELRDLRARAASAERARPARQDDRHADDVLADDLTSRDTSRTRVLPTSPRIAESSDRPRVVPVAPVVDDDRRQTSRAATQPLPVADDGPGDNGLYVSDDLYLQAAEDDEPGGR